MNFEDLRHLEDDCLIETDLCIIGTGPAGLSIAKEFAGTSIRVWLVESGGIGEETEPQTLNEIENVGVPRVMQQELVRYRIFGGASHIWTGRCAPFGTIDFQQRAWVPYSGWPITREDLDPYLQRAGANLGLGPHCYNEHLWNLCGVSQPTPLLNSALLKPEFWQFSKSVHNPSLPTRFGNQFMPQADNIRVLLHANATHINTNDTGTKFESVEVSTLERKRACIKAKVLVLCCGGIENARLLLASNRVQPNGVGNQNDMVGRFLMDHPGGAIGSFDPKRSAKVQDRFGHYWLNNEQGRHIYLHGVALSPALQEAEQLLNCAAFLEEYHAPEDPWQAFVRLKAAMSKPNQAMPQPSNDAMFWRQNLTGETHSTSVYQDALTVLSHPLGIGQGVFRRFVKHRPSIAKASRIDLYCLVEQLPDPESRVTLSDRKDALGMPLSKLNWKINQREKQSIQRLGGLISKEFQRLGLPQPSLADWLNQDSNWESNLSDRAHPTGTTRMATNPKLGVVDANAQVHGIEGLFVAGSSVFPTTGHANPTQMIVAMSIRLADWLKTNHFGA